MHASRKTKGFTIVELLVVIVVIAILAAITVVAYSGITQKAKIASAKSSLADLTEAITIARLNTGTVLGGCGAAGTSGYGITGGYASYTSQALSNAAIDKISAASGIDLSKLKNGDPWGGYYSVDENENENLCNGAQPTACRQDLLRASGDIADTTTLVPYYQLTC